MSAAPFMQLYIADYLGDTQHLSTEQHGAYLLLLMAMWRADGRLPNDEKKLARITRVSLRRWHIVAPDVMAFFDVDGGDITQKRLVEERQKVTSISEKRSASGKLGGDAKALKTNNVPLANATSLPEHSQIPDTKDHKEEEKKEGSADAPADLAFVGRIIRLKADQFERWRKAYHGVPDMLAELTKADDYYSEHPTADGKWFYPISKWLERAHRDALKPKVDPDIAIYRGVL